MAGTVSGRLSLEEGDSVEGLDSKLGGEGKNTKPPPAEGVRAAACE